MIRGIRGAVRVKENSAEAIVRGAAKMLTAILRENHLKAEEVGAVFLTATEDLNAAFPAQAGRALGYPHIPFMCAREMAVPGAMKGVLRALVIAETSRRQEEIRHCYLGATKALRPDLSN